jgi:hypothetical protein
MSYLDKLKQSRNKSQVAYQEFALHTRQGKDGLFCFFEGKDNAYYVPRIKRFINNYHPIHCGGREKVLDVYRLITIHREYDKYKKHFSLIEILINLYHLITHQYLKHLVIQLRIFMFQ